MPAHPPIVIGGPTASGKSGLALQLARHFRSQGKETEILCADSITVYQGLDIGSAKPGAAEQKEFRHHLLDVADPREEFTGGDFVRLALPAILGIQHRGAIPLLVGGTGFYLRALLRGMAVSETENEAEAAAIKEKLTKRAETEGWDLLYRELLRLDPGSASTVHLNDHYRIIRALQAMEIYKKPWSELNKTARAQPWRFPGTRFFCLEVDREELKARIEQRSRAMLDAGLMAEVKSLLEKGVPPEAKPMQSIGYKECVDTLAGREPEATLAERIAQATNRLAKQQRTWFRSEVGVEWLKAGYWESLQIELNK